MHRLRNFQWSEIDPSWRLNFMHLRKLGVSHRSTSCMLKLHKMLNLEMTEAGLIDRIVMRSSPQVGFVEIRNPTTKVQLVQLLAKYEERRMYLYLCV
ncbi:hypothetical protein TNIN_434091 [Trichonephila inaurata madagascariensis]|uniref:Uncharacterized protein n=1 Tax=Trichonephila inaurata madagascariensis TaxID=2747483 RepID=A0A8X7BXU2_9ARAC|nr:hypothetical protein TNIN_363971 [Trichonephila inaurata madagascariensis]GFY56349.1 hypothetical protein TNIN_434091 [Trichonephila inaurata madagascariensis]